MRLWSRLAIRIWWAKRTRTSAALLAVALGAAAVVWVNCCYESVRRATLAWAIEYIGDSHITINSPMGKYDQIPQRIAGRLAGIENVKVVTPVLVQRLRGVALPASRLDAPRPPAPGWDPDRPEIDLRGVRIATEFQVRKYTIVAGRQLQDGDDQVCVLEAGYARSEGIGVGDYILVWTPMDEPHEVRIVGLMQRRRIAEFQKPSALMRLAALQEITGKFALITGIDVVLKDASRAALNRASSRIRVQVRRIDRGATVRSAEARVRQIEAAQAQQQYLLVLLSCIAMLTALFIILSTLSMGMIERVGQLGLLRCIGMTRTQVALMVLVEIMPLGVLGVLLGIPLGLALTGLTVWAVPQYVGAFAVSESGIVLACVAGLLTTLLAAFAPTLAALRASPMDAAHPRATRSAPWMLFGVGLLAVVLLAVQHFAFLAQARRSLEFFQYAIGAVVLLYAAYAFFAPILVRLVGAPAVALAAWLLRIRMRLLQDQVGYAVWRSAGVCCGLMVGLSLIITVSVINSSVARSWQFPKQFPEAYLWSFDQMKPGAGRILRDLPGIGDFTAANSVNVIVEEMPAFGANVMRSVTWFMGCDPDSFFDLIKLEFLEGNEAEARRLLKQGGHVIIADDFARSRNKKLGDDVKVFFGTTIIQTKTFKVAGIVRSPALDIAASYFQMNTQYNVAAAGSVIGTNGDLKKYFQIDGTRLVLLNFALPPQAPPSDWPPPRDGPRGSRLAEVYYDDALPRARRWQRWREAQVLDKLRRKLDAPQSFTGTVRELKDEIDARLSRMMGLLTAVPSIALLVAAIGVANLMTANVLARARQLAVLRAVGATRGLILRLVLGETLVLSLLGSALGLGLGLHLSSNIAALVQTMWGFHIALVFPWKLIFGAIALTVAMCILAGVLPARHAARTDVVQALHVT